MNNNIHSPFDFLFPMIKPSKDWIFLLIFCFFVIIISGIYFVKKYLKDKEKIKKDFELFNASLNEYPLTQEEKDILKREIMKYKASQPSSILVDIQKYDIFAEYNIKKIEISDISGIEKNELIKNYYTIRSKLFE